MTTENQRLREDVRELSKWLNEESTGQINRPSLARVLAALSTPPAPQPAPVDEREVWLPIESAPKDGTRLILWWGGKPVFAGWLDNSQCKHPWAGWQTPSLTPRPQGEPTHYMLLPPAPQTKGQP